MATYPVTIRQESVWIARWAGTKVAGSGISRAEAARRLREKIAEATGTRFDDVVMEVVQ